MVWPCRLIADCPWTILALNVAYERHGRLDERLEPAGHRKAGTSRRRAYSPIAVPEQLHSSRWPLGLALAQALPPQRRRCTPPGYHPSAAELQGCACAVKVEEPGSSGAQGTVGTGMDRPLTRVRLLMNINELLGYPSSDCSLRACSLPRCESRLCGAATRLRMSGRHAVCPCENKGVQRVVAALHLVPLSRPRTQPASPRRAWPPRWLRMYDTQTLKPVEHCARHMEGQGTSRVTIHTLPSIGRAHPEND